MKDYLAPAVVSAVVSALVSGWIAFVNSERKINVENVTQERAKWRDKLRDLCAQVWRVTDSQANSGGNGDLLPRLEELRCAFQTRLNPSDEEDKGILEAIDKIISDEANNPEVEQTITKNEKTDRLNELSERLALLMKYEWERAKYESTSWLFRWKWEPFMHLSRKQEPPREKYEVYKKEIVKNDASNVVNNHVNNAGNNENKLRMAVMIICWLALTVYWIDPSQRDRCIFEICVALAKAVVTFGVVIAGAFVIESIFSLLKSGLVTKKQNRNGHAL